jgi:hypothetical protein
VLVCFRIPFFPFQTTISQYQVFVKGLFIKFLLVSGTLSAYAIALSALQSRIDERPRFGIIGGESSNEAEKVAHQIYKANNTYIYFAGLRRGSR